MIGLLVATNRIQELADELCFYALLIGLLVATLTAERNGAPFMFLCPLDRAARSDGSGPAYLDPRGGVGFYALLIGLLVATGPTYEKERHV